MPRLLDSLDAAVGRTPETLDHGIDYLVQKAPPKRLIESGVYQGGWFTHWDGELNVHESDAFGMALHRWFHFTLDADPWYVVWNIADFNRAGNTAVLVVDRRSGAFHHASLPYLFGQNRVEVDPEHRVFLDPNTGSVCRVDREDRRLAFSVHARQLHIVGEAEHALGPPFVQCTRFHRGRGSLQWYGSFRLLHGTLTIGSEVFPLRGGSLGTYDRTLGHQRGLQNWNWIAAAGPAVCEESGERADIALQVQQDREQARPRVASRKHLVWVDGQLHKIPEAAFEYELSDPESRESGPWRVHSPGRADDRWLEMVLLPSFHRREHRSRVLFHADFNQYYGALTGRVRVGGRTWRLDNLFACAEDSLLQF